MLSNDPPEPIASMTSPAQNTTDLLTYRESTSLPIIPRKESMSQFPFRKDHFYEEVNKLPLSGLPTFESTDKKDNHHFLTLFDDHPEGDCILINCRPIRGMSFKKYELPWANLWLESKTQSNQLFDVWWQKVLAFPRVTTKLNQSRSEESHNLCKVDFFDEALLELAASGVLLEHRVPPVHCRSGEIHSYLSRCGTADNATTVRESKIGIALKGKILYYYYGCLKSSQSLHP